MRKSSHFSHEWATPFFSFSNKLTKVGVNYRCNARPEKNGCSAGRKARLLLRNCPQFALTLFGVLRANYCFHSQAYSCFSNFSRQLCRQDQNISNIKYVHTLIHTQMWRSTDVHVFFIPADRFQVGTAITQPLSEEKINACI